MNKRGFVIGDAVLSAVTIIVIVFIMGTFVYVASSIATLKKPEIQKGTALSLDKDDLLLQSISINNGGEPREVLVYDALNLFVKGDVSQDEIRTGLDALEQKTGKCYYLSLTPEDILGYDSSQKNVPKDVLFLRSKNQPGMITDYETIKLKFSEKSYKIDRLFKPCSK